MGLFVLTVGMILAAAIALVVGYTSDKNGLVYASMVLSVASVIWVKLGRRPRRPAVKSRPGTFPRVEPASQAHDPFQAGDPFQPRDSVVPRDPFQPRDSVTPRDTGAAPSPPRKVAGPAPYQRSRIPEAPTSGLPPAGGPAVGQSPPPGEATFPIEDYETLSVAEILPLLPELGDHELTQILRREEAGAGRVSILSRIDALLASGDDALDLVLRKRGR